MWNVRTRPHLHLIQWFTPLVAGSLLHAHAQAPPAEPPDLPPVIESSGPEAPPDVPIFIPMGTAPTAPAAAPARSGGVLDTLDNLPPVGAPSGSPSQPPARRTQSPTSAPANPGPTPEATATPRVVRFGDVRSESSVRDQFADRRPADSGSKRGGTAPNAPEFRPETPSANRPRTLLDRLMPWRKPLAEPPLLRDKMGLEKDDSDEPTQSARTRNPVELADRVDTEIQKRVDRIARQQVGSRANELDVEVINREVYIRARPMWFWQRKQISEELQKLPGVDSSRLHITVY